MTQWLDDSIPMKRVVIAELLDRDAGTQEEIEASLADLRRINRLFGGISTMSKLVRRVAEKTGAREVAMLDVGGASGDIAELIQQRLRERGVRLDCVVLDRAASHLARGRDALATASGTPALPAVAADALALPFANDSFDLVGCSLFIHHLEPSETVKFVNEALRVCRRAVLINDLRRSFIHLALVYSGWPLYRSRLTKHDGPASVRQAYTPEEIRDLLRHTRAAAVEISNHYLYRMGVIAWKDWPSGQTRAARAWSRAVGET